MISATTISPLNRRIVDDGGGFDPIASAFITAAGITGATQQAALNQLVLDLKGSGSTTNNTDVWSKIYAAYPYCPIDNSTASLTAYKFNLKDPRDLDAAFRITWVNSPTVAVSGINGNATNQYGNTNFNPNSQSVSQNSASLTSSLTTDNNFTDAEIGATSVSTDLWLAPRWGGEGVLSAANANVNLSDSSIGTSIGIFTITRLDSSSQILYYNGNLSTTDVEPSTTPINAELFILAVNASGSANRYSNRTHTFDVIAQGLTASEAKDLADAISTYNTTLGR